MRRRLDRSRPWSVVDFSPPFPPPCVLGGVLLWHEPASFSLPSPSGFSQTDSVSSSYLQGQHPCAFLYFSFDTVCVVCPRTMYLAPTRQTSAVLLPPVCKLSFVTHAPSPQTAAIGSEGSEEPFGTSVGNFIRECRKCSKGKYFSFPLNDWRKKQPATCAQCVLEQHAGQASVRASRRASTGKQDVNNRQARRPRAAHKRRLAARDTASESTQDEAEGADWDECYGVKMSPANPRNVGRGDSTCGGGGGVYHI